MQYNMSCKLVFASPTYKKIEQCWHIKNASWKHNLFRPPLHLSIVVNLVSFLTGGRCWCSCGSISVHGSCNKFAVIRKYILQNKISNLHVSQSFLIPDRKIRYQLKSPNLLWLAYLTQSIWRDGGPRHKWGQSTSAGRRAATRKLSLVVLGHWIFFYFLF